MAEIDVRRTDAHHAEEDDYTMGEVIFWVLGILAIPLVPILMIVFLTPFSGM